MKKRLLLTPMMLLVVLTSCGENTNVQNQLLNSPKPSVSVSATPKPTPIPTPKPTPLPTQAPAAAPVAAPVAPAVPQEFDVEITLEGGVLPRIIVDDGDLNDMPLKIKLKPGEHTIQIFDLASTCKILNKYTVDAAHTRFNFVKGKDCT